MFIEIIPFRKTPTHLNRLSIRKESFTILVNKARAAGITCNWVAVAFRDDLDRHFIGGVPAQGKTIRTTISPATARALLSGQDGWSEQISEMHAWIKANFKGGYVTLHDRSTWMITEREEDVALLKLFWTRPDP